MHAMKTMKFALFVLARSARVSYVWRKARGAGKLNNCFSAAEALCEDQLFDDSLAQKSFFTSKY
jgi:hypothetical protein